MEKSGDKPATAHFRTHTCGELNTKNIGQEILLSGWMHSRRDHGGVIFIDLRDRYGFTQLVFNPDKKELFSQADKLRREEVITVSGKVRIRPDGTDNTNIKTGTVEVVVSNMNIINKAKTPPIEIDDRIVANEDIRLKYRYLDLRRPISQEKIILRHNVVTAARAYFNKHDFIEIQTPLLVKSTPEGARDYVVPSRVNPGRVYALPQSPQLYKQILMVAGMDRYYQVATCLRDEDLRADRQPEHTQFDFEMSFVTSDEIRQFVEGFYIELFKEILGIKLDRFEILSYAESMDRYGTDKPDARFDLFLTNVTEIMKESTFQVFSDVLKKGGIIKCVNPEKDFGRTELDAYIEYCKTLGAKGMAWMKVTDSGLDSNIVKYFPESVQKEILKKIKPKKGSTLMFIADKEKKCNDIISKLRLKLGEDLNLYNPKDFKFVWIKDFPMFSWNEDDEKWDPEHHMFTMLKQEYIHDFEKRPGQVIGDLWDLVLNGIELGSGSIRITDPHLQERVMKFIGINHEEAIEKFGFLLEAYKYGAPIHGGMGLGVDRTVALMCGTNDIREVIAFPKNKNAECPMDGCPTSATDKQMKELHLKFEHAKNK